MFRSKVGIAFGHRQILMTEQFRNCIQVLAILRIQPAAKNEDQGDDRPANDGKKRVADI